MTEPETRFPILSRFYNWIGIQLGITVRIDDSPGWKPYGAGRFPHDRAPGDMQEQYTDALTAWRKNPMAWRTLALTTDYIIGEGVSISSPFPHLNDFITEFWDHPKNRIDNRLESMSDELSRAGDLFPLLFRNSQTGMSYLRFLTKDQIDDIETAKNDWETETSYKQIQSNGEAKSWYTPDHGRARRSRTIALHYSINKPLGAQFGESDLATAIPWLLRYSRMLEDRVRLHWSARAFLWFLKVPSRLVETKREQYSEPPEAGSVIVHDDGEEWDQRSPNLRGMDANSDLKAVRQMIDAASGFPPHWRGEATDINLATAQAMQEPTERHLVRRQNYFVFILQDIIYNAYLRAREIRPDQYPELKSNNYKTLFTAVTPDITKSDNANLALAARDLTAAYTDLADQLPGNSNQLNKLFINLILKFAGEPQDDNDINDIMNEIKSTDTSVTEPSPNGSKPKVPETQERTA